VLKTRAELAERLVARVRALHSYECPGLLVLPVSGGNPAYLDWIGAETEPGQTHEISRRSARP
jgi:periplasmic divalent cation tolerance protein